MKEEQEADTTGPCRNCSDHVAFTTVECPHYGYRTPEEGKITDLLHLLIGNLLTVTIVGAIIGLPLMWRALRRMKRRANSTVTHPI